MQSKRSKYNLCKKRSLHKLPGNIHSSTRTITRTLPNRAIDSSPTSIFLGLVFRGSRRPLLVTLPLSLVRQTLPIRDARGENPSECIIVAEIATSRNMTIFPEIIVISANIYYQSLPYVSLVNQQVPLFFFKHTPQKKDRFYQVHSHSSE